jgi:hypothetical protein
MGKTAYGEGSIYQRSDGRWAAQLDMVGEMGAGNASWCTGGLAVMFKANSERHSRLSKTASSESVHGRPLVTSSSDGLRTQ